MLERFDSRNSYSSKSNKNNQMESYSGVNQVNRRNQNSNNDAMNVFSMQNSVIQQMDKRFEQVQNRMMKNFESAFGGSMMKEFASPFRMFDQVSRQMDNIFSDFSDLHHNMMDSREQGPFTSMQRVFTMQKKVGPNNKVYEEKYFSNNVAQKDTQGNTISERQQAYKNNLNKRDVVAQERMLNSQGRKYVQERVNGQVNSTNHFLNINENDADHFDNMWNDFNQRIGFHNNSSKLLGIGGGRSGFNNRLVNDDDGYSDWSEPIQKPQNKFKSRAQQNSRKQNNKNYKEYDFKDEGRRGDFIPINARSENQPVRLNNQFDGYGRRATDLQPTQPQQANNPPSVTALPSSQTQIPAQNNNIGSHNNIRNNAQQNAQQTNAQRSQATIPQRVANSHPARNAAEQGVFMNRNNHKGVLPKAG